YHAGRIVLANERQAHALETDQEAQDARQGDEIAEGNAGEKEKNSGEQKAGDGAALVLVQRGRYEQPNLIKHIGRSENDAHVNAEGDDEIEVAGRVRVNQVRIEMGPFEGLAHRQSDPVDEIAGQIETGDSPDSDGDKRVDDAFAQLGEVLEKGHRAAGFFF